MTRRPEAGARWWRELLVHFLLIGAVLFLVFNWRGGAERRPEAPRAAVVAFAFGPLHGFGFASGLTTMGLPQDEIPLALLLSNVGVGNRAGLLRDPDRAAGAGVSCARGGVAAARRGTPGVRGWVTGAYWTIQRTLVLLGALR